MKFEIGAKVFHQDAGVGTVIEHVDDKQIRVKFDEKPPILFNGILGRKWRSYTKCLGCF